MSQLKRMGSAFQRLQNQSKGRSIYRFMLLDCFCFLFHVYISPKRRKNVLEGAGLVAQQSFEAF